MIRRGLCAILAAAAASASLAGGPACGQAPERPLLADLTRGEVRINSAFRGAELTLFGAMDGPGDLVVVVAGPPGRATVQRKERFLGLWLVGSRQTFDNVPGYYAVAASAPVTRIFGRGEVAGERIPLDARLAEMTPVGDAWRPAADMAALRDGLKGVRRQQGLFPETLAQVKVTADRLFRVDLQFPSTLPVGTYEVRIYQVHDGRIASAVTKPLTVVKTGLSARISEFARKQDALYGVLAIGLALLAGWIGGWVARRG